MTLVVVGHGDYSLDAQSGLGGHGTQVGVGNVIQHDSRTLILDHIVQGHILQHQTLYVTSVDAVGRQDAQDGGLGYHLRYVVGVVYPGAVLPGHTGQQALALAEEGVHQPRQFLHGGGRAALGVDPVGAQLPLFHSLLERQAAPVLHRDVPQDHVLHLAVHQALQQDGVPGIYVGDADVADFHIADAGQVLGSGGVGVVDSVFPTDLPGHIRHILVLGIIPAVEVQLAVDLC